MSNLIVSCFPHPPLREMYAVPFWGTSYTQTYEAAWLAAGLAVAAACAERCPYVWFRWVARLPLLVIALLCVPRIDDDPYRFAMFVTPLVAAALVVLPALADRLGKQLTLAGWLLTPSLALVTLGCVLLADMQPGDWYERRIDTSNAMQATTIATLPIGFFLGLASIHPRATQAGPRLAATGAFLITLAGFVETHHAVWQSWNQGHWLHAARASAARDQLWWCLLGFAGLMATRPVPEAQGPRRAASSLILAVMLMGSTVSWRTQQLLTDLDVHDVMARPSCPTAPCGIAPDAAFERTTYPSFPPLKAVIEVGWMPVAPPSR